MRDSLKSSGRRPRTAWYWPLVLLALPHCTFDFDSAGPFPSFDPGPEPAASAIMCDIPVVPGEGDDPCASMDEAASGIPLTAAATALATGVSHNIGLDFRPDVVAQCGGPGKTRFQGPFPDGFAVCLNCGAQIPAVYADPTEVCVAQCKDLINFGSGPIPDEGADAFCTANARVSTNFDKDTCFDNACTRGGTPSPDFVDPRRTPENVAWIDLFGTDDFGNTLTRIAETTGPDDDDFNAGAASAQLITSGDAWVEFEATQTNLSHVLGVRASCDDPAACPDKDHSLDDIGFSISLNSNGMVYVIESATPLTVLGPFDPPYSIGERFRVKIKDNHNGTATISYARLIGPCTIGTVCTEDEFATMAGPAPQYPLRVNVSFREQSATIANVTIVRIIEQ